MNVARTWKLSTVNPTMKIKGSDINKVTYIEFCIPLCPCLKKNNSEY